MATLEDDLTQLNFQYLMLLRECARSNPMEAAWRFGVVPETVDHVADLSLEQIKEQAAINRAVISLLPLGNNPVSTAAFAALLAHEAKDQGDHHD
jgi:hypothetical protein